MKSNLLILGISSLVSAEKAILSHGVHGQQLASTCKIRTITVTATITVPFQGYSDSHRGEWSSQEAHAADGSHEEKGQEHGGYSLVPSKSWGVQEAGKEYWSHTRPHEHVIGAQDSRTTGVIYMQHESHDDGHAYEHPGHISSRLPSHQPVYINSERPSPPRTIVTAGPEHSGYPAIPTSSKPSDNQYDDDVFPKISHSFHHGQSWNTSSAFHVSANIQTSSHIAEALPTARHSSSHIASLDHAAISHTPDSIASSGYEHISRHSSFSALLSPSQAHSSGEPSSALISSVQATAGPVSGQAASASGSINTASISSSVLMHSVSIGGHVVSISSSLTSQHDVLSSGNPVSSTIILQQHASASIFHNTAASSSVANADGFHSSSMAYESSTQSVSHNVYSHSSSGVPSAPATQTYVSMSDDSSMHSSSEVIYSASISSVQTSSSHESSMHSFSEASSSVPPTSAASSLTISSATPSASPSAPVCQRLPSPLSCLTGVFPRAGDVVSLGSYPINNAANTDVSMSNLACGFRVSNDNSWMPAAENADACIAACLIIPGCGAAYYQPFTGGCFLYTSFDNLGLVEDSSSPGLAWWLDPSDSPAPNVRTCDDTPPPEVASSSSALHISTSSAVSSSFEEHSSSVVPSSIASSTISSSAVHSPSPSVCAPPTMPVSDGVECGSSAEFGPGYSGTISGTQYRIGCDWVTAGNVIAQRPTYSTLQECLDWALSYTAEPVKVVTWDTFVPGIKRCALYRTSEPRRPAGPTERGVTNIWLDESLAQPIACADGVASVHVASSSTVPSSTISSSSVVSPSPSTPPVCPVFLSQSCEKLGSFGPGWVNKVLETDITVACGYVASASSVLVDIVEDQPTARACWAKCLTSTNNCAGYAWDPDSLDCKLFSTLVAELVDDLSSYVAGPPMAVWKVGTAGAVPPVACPAGAMQPSASASASYCPVSSVAPVP